jgi:diguanylate cyclase (GGDEF)-like protein
MIDFPGYTNMELLSETLNASEFRALRTCTGETTVIKLINMGHTPAAHVSRLRHEFEMIRKSGVEGAVRILDIVAHEDRLALVLEDFRGLPLKRHFTGPLPLSRVLDIGIGLAEILKDLHARNIIHRQVKPSAILYHPETDTFKVSDFGIAAEFAGLNTAVHRLQHDREALAYMSPEQTGRMNCALDYRTDLYSLGIVVYELLTGGVPFQSDEPMEVIHAHIARMPAAPHKINPQVPPVVSDIVLRLLAKTPEERYQSALGLLRDLTECRRRLTPGGHVDAFEIGKQDVSLRFNIPQVLVGREQELNSLLGAFRKTTSGEAVFLLVSGEPGVGKSALVNEIKLPIAREQGFFIAGKYDPLRQAVPYSAIIQAGQGLARMLLAERDDRIDEFRRKLIAALGSNGRIITDIIPEIGRIIGPQPAIPELSSEEARNRFRMAFKNFVHVFTDPSHPLIVFLDDLQWADPASLDLLHVLSQDRDLSYFLFIGAFRHRQPAHHPLMRTFDAMQAAGVQFTHLELKQLDHKNVNRLLSCFLRGKQDLLEPLGHLVYQKTRGNPFFINQFLKRLYENKCLVLDPVTGWRWDAASIEKMQVTDNVVEFMADRLRVLQEKPLSLLKIGACIGNRFDADMLAAIAELPVDKMLETLDVLQVEGLIIFRDGQYRFHHDRIHEAAYSLLLPEDQERLHYRIGRYKLDNTPPEAMFNQLFYIADQLNKAHALLTTAQERRQVSELNLQAGVKAKEATAYAAAVNYLQAGIDLLPSGSWRTDYRLTYDLFIEQMESQYLARNFEEAEKLFKAIIGSASKKTDIAKAYNIMIVLYTNMRSPEDAIGLGLEALQLFGIRLSRAMGRWPVLYELIKVRIKLRKLSLDDIPALPLCQDPSLRACHTLMLNIATPAYYVNPNLFAYLVLRGINENLKFGLQDHSAAVFMSLATVLQTVTGDYEQAYRIGKMALALNRKIDNRKQAGLVHHVFAFFLQHWKKHAAHDVEVFEKVYQLCLEAGNFIFAGHSVNAAVDCRLMIGDRLDEILQETEKYREFMQLVKDPFIAARYRENIQYIRNLKGTTPERLSLTGEDFDEDEHLVHLTQGNNIYGLCFAMLYKTKLLYLYGKYEEAGRTAANLEKHIKATFGTLIVSEHHFYYCMILTALLGRQDEDIPVRFLDKMQYKAVIRKYLPRMARWALLCPENFRHKHDLIRAEVMAVDGRIKEALAFYHSAIRGALRNGYIHEEALACERLSVFYQRLDAREEARIFMQRAYQRYGQWGAAAKQEDLLDRYADLKPAAKTALNDPAPPPDAAQAASKLLDWSTVMQVSQAISSEIMLDRLLHKIMQLSLTSAGAQRVFLISHKDGRLMIEAGEELEREIRRTGEPLPLEESRDLSQAIVQYVSHSLEPVILPNAARRGPFINDPHVLRNQCKSILCMPILDKGRLSAILYMENNLAANVFTPERLELLGIIASQAAISLENARLFSLATTDGLTQLLVPRYFQLLLENEIERSRRFDRPLSLVMIDIDNFKQFNDDYGHLLGDEALKAVALLLRDNLRSIDIAARYGGEEFVLILPETNNEQALIVAEKVRRCIEGLRIAHHHEQLRVTVSLGIATFPDQALEKKSLIASADDALYTSKRNGKNRISVGRKMDFLPGAPAEKKGPVCGRETVEKCVSAAQLLEKGEKTLSGA